MQDARSPTMIKVAQAELFRFQTTTNYSTKSTLPTFNIFGVRFTSSSSSSSATAQKLAECGKETSLKSATRGGYETYSAPRKVNYWLTVYKQLAKFRLSALVVSTSAAGFVLGSDENINWEGLAWTCIGTMAASSCANTFNQLSEIKYDALMKRTHLRPLPSARISPAHALAFAALMGVGGVSILACKTNELTAGLGAANIWLYAAIYTPLKQISVINTWVGALVGAIPPLMGWAAARGELDPQAGALAAVLYFWQLPHFLALAWMFKDDYALGKHRMLSIVDTTGRRTAASALRNCVYLLPVGLFSYAVGLTTLPFAVEAAAVTSYMGFYAFKFYSSPSTASARMLFRSSLLHLPILMTAMIIHRIPMKVGEEQPMNLPEWMPSWQGMMVLAESVLPIRIESSIASNSASEEKSISAKNANGSFEVDIAPFPFISVPHFPSMSCPSRAVCDKDDETDLNKT